jgi:hypothetical protein
VYFEQLFTNNTNACFSECGDRDTKRGVGIGTDFQIVREENGTERRVMASALLTATVIATALGALVLL